MDNDFVVTEADFEEPPEPFVENLYENYVYREPVFEDPLEPISTVEELVDIMLRWKMRIVSIFGVEGQKFMWNHHQKQGRLVEQ